MSKRYLQISSIRNRLSKNLNATDRRDIGKALVDYMTEERIKASEIENGDNLI